MTVLSVSGLSKQFDGVRVVDGVSFDVRAGELLAMIGPNGAGKTTCFNMLNGQLSPDSGSVRLAGADITGKKPREIWRMGVGRTFQVAATFASMSVRENVQMALLSYHRRAANVWAGAARLHHEEADALLEEVGMREQGGRACATLAYGDLKRTEMAMALANRPRLLLMDEPTAGMAPQERRAAMELAERIARGRGIAVLFTEHDMDVVFRHADRVIVLYQGRVIAQGAPADVRSRADVRQIYLGTAQ